MEKLLEPQGEAIILDCTSCAEEVERTEEEIEKKRREEEEARRKEEEEARKREEEEETRRREEEEEARRREKEEEARRREKEEERREEEEEARRREREKEEEERREEEEEARRRKREKEENPEFTLTAISKRKIRFFVLPCADMAATWLPRPVICCPGVHVAFRVRSSPGVEAAVSKHWGEKRTNPKHWGFPDYYPLTIQQKTVYDRQFTDERLGVVSFHANREENRKRLEKSGIQTETSPGDLDRLHLRLLHLLLRHGDRQHAVFHGRLHLIHLGILRQPEPPQETATAAFDAVPVICLLLQVSGSLAADLQHSPLLLHLHLFLLQPRQIRLEHVRLRRLLPVDVRVGEGGRLRRPRRGPQLRHRPERVEEGIPHVQRERIEHAAPASKQTGHDRHLLLLAL